MLKSNTDACSTPTIHVNFCFICPAPQKYTNLAVNFLHGRFYFIKNYTIGQSLTSSNSNDTKYMWKQQDGWSALSVMTFSWEPHGLRIFIPNSYFKAATFWDIVENMKYSLIGLGDKQKRGCSKTPSTPSTHCTPVVWNRVISVFLRYCRTFFRNCPCRKNNP